MNDPRTVVHVRFEGLSPAEANVAAAQLRDQLQRSGGDLKAELRREREDTQDFGATLVLLLGTEAAVVLARAVHAFVARRGSKVVIQTPEGKVLATGSAAANIDVASTTAAITGRGDER